MLTGRIRGGALIFLLICSGTAFLHAAEKIDINRASIGELEKLPEMTPAWAERIVRFRPYRTKLDLVREGVIPAELYRKIREEIIAHHEQPR